jgi:uncharacterized repeat protein (TIGR01451 family)
MSAGCRSSHEARTARARRARRPFAMLVGLLALALMAAFAPVASAVVSPSQQWMTTASPGITAVGGSMNIGFGATGVSATLTTTSASATLLPAEFPKDQGSPISSPAQGANAATYVEPDAPAGATSIVQEIPALPSPPTFQNATVTFNKPVIGPMLHVVNLDGSTATIGGTTTTGAPLVVTPFIRNGELTISGNTLNSDVNPANQGGCDDEAGATLGGGNPNGSCGSIQFGPGSPVVKSFTLANAGLGDTWEWALSFPTAPLTKQFSPSPIYVGQTSTLTFTIANPSNPGQVALTPLDFTDALPAGVTLADGSVTNNGNCGAPAVADNGGGALGAGDTGVTASNISVAVGATCTITINVTSTTPGDYLNDNNNLSTTVANLIPNASTTLQVLPRADLEIEKTTAATVVAGEEAIYDLAVTNHGPSTATNAVVADDLPSAATFVSASSGCTEANKKVTCTIASLPVGQTRHFKVTVKIASSAKSCESMRNDATVTSDVNDPDLSNNRSSICGTHRSDLSITKDPSQTAVAPGGQVMYTLVVKNNGPSDEDNVKVTDPMAAGLSLASAKPSQGSCSTSGGQVSCDLGTLDAGGSAQILVTATVTSTSPSPAGPCGPTTPNSITNTATVTGDSLDPDTSNNKDKATVCPQPGPEPPFDLVVAKTASAKSVYVGQPLTYTVTVTNNGPGASPNTQITDTLNHPASVVSVKASQGSCTKSIPMTCQLGNLPAGAKVTIKVKVKLRESGCKQRNAASATGEGTDTNPANNMARVDVCAKPVPLQLTKVADQHSLRAGDTVGYTIRVSNPTAGEARNVKVCDKLPKGLVYVSSKATAKFSNGQYCWTISTLGAHKSRSFRITVRALSSASGDRVNRATASAKGAKTRHAKDPVHVLAARATGGGVTG